MQLLHTYNSFIFINRNFIDTKDETERHIIKPTILLVDDNKAFLNSASNFLNTHTEVKIVGMAETGEEGLEKFYDLNPDILLLDLSMPGIGGLQVVRMLKSQNVSAKIIIVTLYDTPEYSYLAKTAGADGFLPKSEFGTKIVPLINNLCNKQFA